MLERLFSGRQTEQLWRPGSPFPGNVPVAMATLFPGTGPVNQSWTPPELYMVARSRLFWMFQIQPGSTLPGNPEAWAPFMLYLTLPLATLQAAIATAQGTGYFRVQHVDIPGTLDRCLNVSLSPRSAYLFFTFQLSIMQMQHVEYTFPADTEICTLALELPTVAGAALWDGPCSHVESTLCRLFGKDGDFGDTDGPFMADFSLHSALSRSIPTCGGPRPLL